MTILVTGASGHLGKLVVQSLLDEGVPADQIVAGARDTSKVADLAAKGVRTAVVDYDKPDTVTAAFDGVDKVLLISGMDIGRRVSQHKGVVDAAVAAEVELIVYTSAPKATDSELVLAPEHKGTEEVIYASGLPYTILRNGWYTENYLDDVRQAKDTGVIANSVGAGKVSSAPRSDYATAAAKVLTTDGHAGKVYELSGDTAWTFDELAEAAATVLGREVHYEALSPEDEIAGLRAAGLDEDTIGFVSALNGNVRDGLVGHVTGDLSSLLGRPTIPLEDALRTALF